MPDDQDIERLFAVGFCGLGKWVIDGVLSYQLTPDNDEGRTRLRAGAALYAFVSNGEILYVGKTSTSLLQRFAGYRRPASDQQTNLKCNRGIVNLLTQGQTVEILSLSGVSPLRWGEFELNIAAGLEDSLIAQLAPKWNGRPDVPITDSESIEREALHLPDVSLPLEPDPPPIGNFTINLGPTYFNQGIINPGIKVSDLLAAHGETVRLRLGANDPTGLQIPIDRNAVESGSPRLRGGKQVAAWFQRHFRLGDTVTATILSPHEVVLELPKLS